MGVCLWNDDNKHPWLTIKPYQINICIVWSARRAIFRHDSPHKVTPICISIRLNNVRGCSKLAETRRRGQSPLNICDRYCKLHTMIDFRGHSKSNIGALCLKFGVRLLYFINQCVIIWMGSSMMLNTKKTNCSSWSLAMLKRRKHRLPFTSLKLISVDSSASASTSGCAFAFTANALNALWHKVRQPPPGAYGCETSPYYSLQLPTSYLTICYILYPIPYILLKCFKISNWKLKP